jgi:hypothetical protein
MDIVFSLNLERETRYLPHLPAACRSCSAPYHTTRRLESVVKGARSPQDWRNNEARTCLVNRGGEIRGWKVSLKAVFATPT